jgi:hypothetical protein
LQFVEQVLNSAGRSPQALKRGRIFDGLTARVKLVPFPFVAKVEFFRKLPGNFELRCLTL